jgi:hypothetical protein
LSLSFPAANPPLLEINIQWLESLTILYKKWPHRVIVGYFIKSLIFKETHSLLLFLISIEIYFYCNLY